MEEDIKTNLIKIKTNHSLDYIAGELISVSINQEKIREAMVIKTSSLEQEIIYLKKDIKKLRKLVTDLSKLFLKYAQDHQK